MAKKGIREFDAKRLLANGLPKYYQGKFKIGTDRVLITPDTDLSKIREEHPWLNTAKLVAKPDQLFGKRGKNNLLFLDASALEVIEWIGERMNLETTIIQTTGSTTGVLSHFLIEPFIPHRREYYVAIVQKENGDKIYFSTEGGVDIEAVWDTVVTIDVPPRASIDDIDIEGRLPEIAERKEVGEFIRTLYRVFDEYYFTYLELNPFSFADDKIVILDTVAKLDDTASFICSEIWGEMEFPKQFGSINTPEEAYITQLDERTGASLKLTILNPGGIVWNLVAGGGASVIYADTVADLGFSSELANYGEYSGNPSMELTYEYTKTVLNLMTREKDPQGRPKYLLIGGGIANFTDVAKTFTGIIRAIEDYQEKMKEIDVRIYVRRGGPNYKEGLENMKRLGERIGIPIDVYGPETHMTRIVSLALKGGE